MTSTGSIRLEQVPLLMGGFDARAGLPILGNGGGRIATPSELKLLAASTPGEHADRAPTMLPYRWQSTYDRQPVETIQRIATLENEHLRAVFLLDLGGRLWRLTDLETGRELLHQPDWIQPANLALRNAWFAGGVEWNLGVTGHWGLTCEPVSAAVVKDGDVEVLRLWALERMLGLVWRLDVWLPAGARQLSVHITLANPHDHDVPVYWWSNAATPLHEGGRVLVDAPTALFFGYTNDLRRVDLPEVNGVDISRPELAKDAADYFFETRLEHPWIAAVDSEGEGLLHASTRRLLSRKLFVWGTAAGGRTWQRFLSGEGSYIEIQGGLARTQLEHLRLPAGQTWSWTESYGPLAITSEAVNADWPRACAMAGAHVDATWLDEADELLARVARVPVDPEAISPAPENQGWGALACAVGDLPEDPSTPFDPVHLDEEQRAWHQLASTHEVPSRLIDSVMVGEAWRERLAQATASVTQQVLLGMAEHAAGHTEAARALWRTSVEAEPTMAALRALALTGPAEEAVDLLVAARELPMTEGPARDQLLVEMLEAMCAADRAEDILGVVEGLDERSRALPRVAYLECWALVRSGQGERAGALLARPLVMPDLREGDLSLDRLWFDHQELIGGNDPLPAHYDFRMHTE